MKKITKISLILLLVMPLFSANVNKKDGGLNLMEIATVLKHIESNNNTHAVGDSGDALGILQIHKACVEDVNRFYGTEYTHEDTKEIIVSEEIFVKYIRIGIKLYKKRCGTLPNEFDIVRMWNGGIYRGYEYPSTIPYLKKYRKHKKYMRENS